MRVRVIADNAKLEDIAASAGQMILLRLARDVVRIARRSTIRARDPSAPGAPPHEHYGDLDRSITVGINESTGDVVVGPRTSIVGERGNVLEFAGTYDPDAGRDRFGRFLRGHASRKAPSGAKRARPFMRPAFERAISGGRLETGSQVTTSFT
jgi:hypothetical protein